MIDAAMSGTLSTVAVTSRSAYKRLVRGYQRARTDPMMHAPTLAKNVDEFGRW
jgi:hypothetical protein